MRKEINVERNKISRSALHKILYDSLIESQKGNLKYDTKRQLNDLVTMFLEDPFDKNSLVNQETTEGYMSMPEGAYNKMLKLYLQNAFTINKPVEGRIYRNNKIVDMTYEVLTHETSCAEMLNPGGFDQQKKAGYLAEALRNTDISYEELNKMSIDELKDLISKNKNLMFTDTQIQFYKQNRAAGSLIGIFAVNRTAHAVIENEGYKMNVDAACDLKEPFTIAGMEFGGDMPIDVRFDRNGQSVGKTLGSLVASAADAVKDPVLNLMNINGTTANILNALVRLGMPFDDAALFLSQKAVTDILNTYSVRNVTSYVSLSKLIDERLTEIEDKYNIDENSPLQKEELTKEEIIEGIRNNDSAEIEYKTLKALQKFQDIADAMRMPTFATRFNSISSAVGPLIVDNLITEYKMQKLSEESNIIDDEWEAVDINDLCNAHPILKQFKRAFGIAGDIFGNMPANSTGFRNITEYISNMPIGNVVLNNRKLLKSLSDFYQSYLLIASGAINGKELSYYISQFPKEFMKKNCKETYKDNALIQAIKYGTDKGGRATLQIDIAGLDNTQKEKLSSAWIDLHKKNPELSEQLFKYCFFRGGAGFNPKTFMSLVPTYVKEKLKGYTDTYRILPLTVPAVVFDQFVRNNWDNNSLVPRVKASLSFKGKGIVEIYKPNEVAEFKGRQYFKIKLKGRDVLYEQEFVSKNSIGYREISPLGSNKDYIEMNTSNIEKPLNITPEAKEETMSKEDVVEALNMEEQSNTALQSEQQQIDLLHQIFMDRGKTLEQADRLIQKTKKLSAEEKKSKESKIKEYLKNRLKVLKVNYNEETIEREYKKLC